MTATVLEPMPQPTSHPGLRRRPQAAAPVAVTAAAATRSVSEDLFEAASAIVREACTTRRFGDVADAARHLLPSREQGSPARSMARMLSESRSAAIEAPGEDRLWMLQRLDGSMVALVRLRDNGEVGGAVHPNESRWTLRDGRLLLTTPDGQPTTAFTLGAERQGRRVMLGLFMDRRTVHVLSEVDCAYARLRSLDPELVGSTCGVIDPAQLPPIALPPVPAVVLASQRTGSHLLLNLLNSSGRVFFDAELLNEKQISVFGSNLRHEESGLLYYVRENDPVHLAKVMMARSHHLDGRLLDDVRVRGFKLFAKHSRTAWNWVMDEPRMRIVHLYRANLLAEYSSLRVAYAEGHWVGGPSDLRSRRIPFDAQRFLRFVDMKQRYLAGVREQLAARSGPSIEIEYSDFSRQRVNQVLEFLLDEPQDASFDALGLKRQLNERVIDRFDNPDDVRRCLAALGQEAWAGIERKEVETLR